MRVVGIDASLTSTGVAVIGDGLCTTKRIESSPPKRALGDKTPVPIADRRRRIHDIVLDVTSWAPSFATALVVIEGPSYASAGANTWDRAWLWGAIVERMLANDVPVAIVPPTTRAKWASGSGAAGKSPIAVHLSRMWPELDPGISDDEWDALALASMGAQAIRLIPVDLARHREQIDRVVWPDFVVSSAA